LIDSNGSEETEKRYYTRVKEIRSDVVNVTNKQMISLDLGIFDDVERDAV